MSKLKSLFILIVLLSSLLYHPPAAATQVGPALVDPVPLPALGQAGSAGTNQLPPMAFGVVLVGLKPGVAIGASDLDAQAGDAALNAALARIGVQRRLRRRFLPPARYQPRRPRQAPSVEPHAGLLARPGEPGLHPFAATGRCFQLLRGRGRAAMPYSALDFVPHNAQSSLPQRPRPVRANAVHPRSARPRPLAQ